MDSMAMWNYIADKYLLLYNSTENFIQKEWENYFSELFDYKKIFDEINAQRKIHIGSSERVIPDIILRKDNKDIIDVELKQYNMDFTPQMESQLKSYLKLLNLSVGIIICKKIYLCWLDYSRDTIYKIAVSFEKDNPDGAKFMQLINKSDFNVESVKKYIQDSCMSKINVEKIKNELTEEYIKKVLQEHLLKTYSESDIEKALKGINISLNTTPVAEKIHTSENVVNTSHVYNPSHFKPISKIEEDNDFPSEPDYIMIKTSYNRIGQCNGSLYDATRHAWKVKYDTVIKYKYVLAVIDKRVKEVYTVGRWQNAPIWENDYGDMNGRLEFVGEVAPEEIRRKFINKIIPYKYRKQGMASPVIYSK